MERWQHQVRGASDALAAIDNGVRRVLLTSPTGGGKTRIVLDLIEQVVHDGWHAILYTNRRMLIEQLSRNLTEGGVEHGVRAAGHADERDLLVQISSIPTEAARTLKTRKWTIHGAGKKCLAVIDEAHLNASDSAEELIRLHAEEGHAVLGVTATPLSLGHLYDRLIQAGVNSELRACGALVPCHHYAPDEPDLRRFEKELRSGADLSEEKAAKAMGGRTALLGRVWHWFNKLNPDRRPTVLFAPGVPESRWFAQQFSKAGVPAAHIDGGEVWIDGEAFGSDRDSRAELLARFESGRVKVVCNRFVMREGIDCPWIEHMVLATAFGSLQSYLQSGGRGLRASPKTGKTRLTLQDHGGNWWRHGSLNEDRHWRLEYTPGIVAGLREDRLREKREREPMRCPRCAQVLMRKQCPCGFVVEERLKFRPVVTTDGTLVEMHGDIFKPRRRPHLLNTIELWRKCYYAARASGMTFRQAEALYVQRGETHTWPPRDLKFMPKYELDWFKKVSDVPRSRLIGCDPTES